MLRITKKLSKSTVFLSSVRVALTIVLSFSVSCATTQDTQTPQIDSLMWLRSELSYKLPSEVLTKYQNQLKYRKNNPKQDLLHELNLVQLSLLAGQTAKAREHLKIASNYIDWQDYTSILDSFVDITFVTTVSEKYTLLPADYLMLNYSLTLSYLMDGDIANALVGIRSLQNTLSKLETNYDLKKVPSIAFFYFFAASIYEQNKLFDDARIDYEKVASLQPKWPNLTEHLYRIYHLTRDEQKLQELNNMNLRSVSSLPAKDLISFSPKIIILQNISAGNRVSNEILSVDIQRTTTDGVSTSWTADREHSRLIKVRIDREFADLTPNKFDNPLYLIHVNPFSILYLSFREIGKNFLSLWLEEAPEFTVHSVIFPDYIEFPDLYTCVKDQATCALKSVGMNHIPDSILDKGNFNLHNSFSSLTPIPIK